MYVLKDKKNNKSKQDLLEIIYSNNKWVLYENFNNFLHTCFGANLFAPGYIDAVLDAGICMITKKNKRKNKIKTNADRQTGWEWELERGKRKKKELKTHHTQIKSISNIPPSRRENKNRHPIKLSISIIIQLFIV